MRWFTLTSLLTLLAPAALGAPIPLVIVGDWGTDASKPGGGFPVKVGRLPAEVVSRLTQVSSRVPESFNNRHYSPPESMDPSVVLAVPRPLETDYLMRLSAKSAPKPEVSAESDSVWPTDTPDKAQSVVSDVVVERTKAISPSTTTSALDPFSSEAMEDLLEEVELVRDSEFPSDLSRMELRFRRTYRQVDSPCYHMRIRRDYNDMLVISLVAVFLLVIVVVEFWDTNDELSPSKESEGSIKLEADEPMSEKNQLLSVQAPPLEFNRESELYPEGDAMFDGI